MQYKYNVEAVNAGKPISHLAPTMVDALQWATNNGLGLGQFTVTPVAVGAAADMPAEVVVPGPQP